MSMLGTGTVTPIKLEYEAQGWVGSDVRWLSAGSAFVAHVLLDPGLDGTDSYNFEQKQVLRKHKMADLAATRQ